MKPLVYYCRWHGATLRLWGRDETAVWGQLIYAVKEGETDETFRFDLKTWQLTLEGADGARVIELDEMGVER